MADKSNRTDQLKDDADAKAELALADKLVAEADKLVAKNDWDKFEPFSKGMNTYNIVRLCPTCHKKNYIDEHAASQVEHGCYHCSKVHPGDQYTPYSD